MNVMQKIVCIGSIVFGLSAVSYSRAQTYTPPSLFPSDSAYAAINCADPTIAPASDPCTDDARDHRNIVGAGTTPAYLMAQDGTYLYLRVRVEDDPRQSSAFVAFGWGFGIDTNGNGAFEAYISLIGQGNSDRLEVLDQDSSNGTTPSLTQPMGSGTDTSLRPIMSNATGGTWATATAAPAVGAMQNYCSDDPDAGDWYITVAVPLVALRDFGALGGVVAYAGTSSEFSGIQNDFVCANGTPASCTMGAMCASGVCLTGVGRCGPPVVQTFLGCVDQDTNADLIDEGCTASAPNCVVTSTSSSCVQCLTQADCNDGNACTTDSCVSNACTHASLSAGTACTGGVCNGAVLNPVCVACIDNATGTNTDSGCGGSTRLCDVSGTPHCVACVTAAECDDSNACTTDSCVAGACGHPAKTAGTSCSGGVCNGSGSAPACVLCVDSMSGSAVDPGCNSGMPYCISSAGLQCVECVSAADCGDSNECTTDACVSGSCTHTSQTAGSVCTGGVCTGAPVSPQCVACIDNMSGTSVDSGCTGAAPQCVISGSTPACAGCTMNADCNDGNECTTEMCVLGVCARVSVAAQTPCTGGVCNGASVSPACVVCLDTSSGGTPDFGCSGSLPVCNATLGVPTCVQCGGASDCVDSNDCTVDSCDVGMCMHMDATTGAACGSGVCKTTLSAPICVTCVDDQNAALLDSGCLDSSPLCDASGSLPMCVVCFDSGAGIDLGCSSPMEVCSSNGGSTRVCVDCEDTASGGDTDFGCGGDTPLCLIESGHSQCVECLGNSDCGVGQHCNTGLHQCAVGCQNNSNCSGTTPRCDTGSGICVACLSDLQCPGTQICGAGHSCTFPDHDGDAIADNVDVDDDNDGIPDAVELGTSDLSRDTDGDGIQDFQDPDNVDCANLDGNGICDAIPQSLDFDGDGIPNHLDLDADGDGIPDLVEAGGADGNNDGRIDNFIDANADGFDDPIMVNPLPLPNTDSTEGPDYLDLDADGDTIYDVIEAGGMDNDRNGFVDNPTDTDRDGLVDRVDRDQGGTPWPLPDTDGDGKRDFQDIDDDEDLIPTKNEDIDHDGDPRDDDRDQDGIPNYLDPDDDNDGRLTRDEDVNGDGDPRNDDTNFNGVPDFLEQDRGSSIVGGGYSGGACSAVPMTRSGSWIVVLLLMAVGALVRSRPRRRM